MPSFESGFPASLLLVTVSEHNVDVREGRGIVLGELFETNDGSGNGGCSPAVRRDDSTSNSVVPA